MFISVSLHHMQVAYTQDKNFILIILRASKNDVTLTLNTNTIQYLATLVTFMTHYLPENLCKKTGKQNINKKRKRKVERRKMYCDQMKAIFPPFLVSTSKIVCFISYFTTLIPMRFAVIFMFTCTRIRTA